MSEFFNRAGDSTNVFLGRVVGYLLGRDAQAAAVSRDLLDNESQLDWMGPDPDDVLAKYALEAAIRSHSYAEASAKSVTDKASGLLTLIVGAFILAIGGTSLALHVQHNQAWVQAISVVLFCLLDLVLLLAALNAFLGTGVSRGGGVNLHRLAPESQQLAALMAKEAMAWHKGALMAMEDAGRRARDLFAARRWLLGALMIAIVAMTSLAIDQVAPSPIGPNTGGAQSGELEPP